MEFMGWKNTTVTPASGAGINLHPQDSHVYPWSPVGALLRASFYFQRNHATKKVRYHGRFLPVFMESFQTPRQTLFNLPELPAGLSRCTITQSKLISGDREEEIEMERVRKRTRKRE